MREELCIACGSCATCDLLLFDHFTLGESEQGYEHVLVGAASE
jgi:ferredoxin